MIPFALYNNEYCRKRNRHHFGHHNGNPNAINSPNHWKKQNGANLEHQCAQKRNQGGG